MKYYQKYKDLIIAISLIIILFLSIILLIKVYNKEPPTNNIEELTITTTNEIASLTKEDKYFVDIKGAVKKPGVYEVTKGSIVNDIIKLAGGLKSNAYTKNINLSQVTNPEMVIYIYTESEIKKLTTPVVTNTTCTTNVIEVNNCITSTTKKVENTTSNLVNINTASKEELMDLTGIGASKADAIIKYRTESKFVSIEDLKNVSGIGDSLYDSIKNNITV